MTGVNGTSPRWRLGAARARAHHPAADAERDRTPSQRIQVECDLSAGRPARQLRHVGQAPAGLQLRRRREVRERAVQVHDDEWQAWRLILRARRCRGAAQDQDRESDGSGHDTKDTVSLRRRDSVLA